MGRFLIFIGITFVLSAIGLGVWWLGNKIYLSIRKENERFEIEKAGYDAIKDGIREEK